MKASSTWRPTTPLDTPYKKARQEWDQRLGASAIQAMNWRRATFAMAAIVLLAVTGLIYLGAQPKAQPYFVQIDKIGAPSCLGPVDRTTHDFKPSPDSTRYHLRRFIDDTRSLSSDPAIVRRNWLDAYKLVTASAANQLNTWIHENNPLLRVGSERVSVEVVGVMPITADTWQADWTETVWDDTGTSKSQIVWRGTFHVVFRLPETEEEIVANPIGLFVDEFHWAQLQELSKTP